MVDEDDDNNNDSETELSA